VGRQALGMSVVAGMTMSQMAKRTAERYRGERAIRYESDRIKQDRWRVEFETIQEMLSGYPEGTRVLDCPCGTGRLFDYFAERGFVVIALDLNEDMLAEARKKPRQPGIVSVGDIFRINIPDGSVDVALAVRIMNLIEESDMQIALRELQRVATASVIFTLRICEERQHGRYRAPQTLRAVRAALLPGWRLEECRAIHRNDFCMVRLAR
jgi:ubiquinone/menaquinone biosynthesis C-methylase UbiE